MAIPWEQTWVLSYNYERVRRLGHLVWKNLWSCCQNNFKLVPHRKYFFSQFESLNSHGYLYSRILLVRTPWPTLLHTQQVTPSHHSPRMRNLRLCALICQTMLVAAFCITNQSARTFFVNAPVNGDGARFSGLIVGEEKACCHFSDRGCNPTGIQTVTATIQAQIICRCDANRITVFSRDLAQPQCDKWCECNLKWLELSQFCTYYLANKKVKVLGQYLGVGTKKSP